ncbi:MAG: hypothetical protein CMO74_14675 [Verrucomicrobiales bacterium]|nr:hypothetical protein [Verrucomicrobiales bacterium]|tara:strand:- start:420 stop:698 length:279 start_codon:yes stop_codon:yes gene_type:complete
MIKIKKDFWTQKDVPVIHFRQAKIEMTFADGKKVGTIKTLDFQEDAPTKAQWLESVQNQFDGVVDITFQDWGVQSCNAPEGHPAWKLLEKNA